MFCSENISLEISDVLDVLETKCVSTSNGRPDVSLAVGSCLFYRESLVWSHFNSTDLGVISDICKHFGMIATVCGNFDINLTHSLHTRVHQCRRRRTMPCPPVVGVGVVGVVVVVVAAAAAGVVGVVVVVVAIAVVVVLGSRGVPHAVLCSVLIGVRFSAFVVAKLGFQAGGLGIHRVLPGLRHLGKHARFRRLPADHNVRKGHDVPACEAVEDLHRPQHRRDLAGPRCRAPTAHAPCQR